MANIKNTKPINMDSCKGVFLCSQGGSREPEYYKSEPGLYNNKPEDDDLIQDPVSNSKLEIDLESLEIEDENNKIAKELLIYLDKKLEDKFKNGGGVWFVGGYKIPKLIYNMKHTSLIYWEKGILVEMSFCQAICETLPFSQIHYGVCTADGNGSSYLHSSFIHGGKIPDGSVRFGTFMGSHISNLTVIRETKYSLKEFKIEGSEKLFDWISDDDVILNQDIVKGLITLMVPINAVFLFRFRSYEDLHINCNFYVRSVLAGGGLMENISIIDAITQLEITQLKIRQLEEGMGTNEIAESEQLKKYVSSEKNGLYRTDAINSLGYGSYNDIPSLILTMPDPFKILEYYLSKDGDRIYTSVQDVLVNPTGDRANKNNQALFHLLIPDPSSQYQYCVGNILHEDYVNHGEIHHSNLASILQEELKLGTCDMDALLKPEILELYYGKGCRSEQAKLVHDHGKVGESNAPSSPITNPNDSESSYSDTAVVLNPLNVIVGLNEFASWLASMSKIVQKIMRVDFFMLYLLMVMALCVWLLSYTQENSDPELDEEV